MLKIDAGSAVPVYEQLKRQIKLGIVSGKYPSGYKMPSIRQLASQLKINPNTIAKVYRQLETEKFIASKTGSGFFVKMEKEQMGSTRKILLAELADEFISKAIELGFTPDELIKTLSEKLERKSSNDKTE
ncbi:MAG: GntR family transcriptional regulator [Candidatus Sabulitectum sp.]|nr:GntR family transcriptional regulator [Candidatus Sabulitectum sp.]MCK5842558.1 GntR family transcriptional regulator [Candidatus Sabulitectum sp.]